MRLRALILVVAAAAATLHAQMPTFDLILRNGRIVDGTGSPWLRGEVAIAGDTITAVSARIDGTARRTIDVNGQVISPGFIDIHTHARRGINEVPTAANYIRQGVTTVIEGPDGSSPIPLAPFLAGLDRLQKSVNIGSFIGQGSVRSAVIGDVNRRATPDEIARMEALVEQGMRDGAFGLSTGLYYVPGTFTPTDEVIALAKVAGRFGGMHESHMREETVHVGESVMETIAIGEGGGLPTHVSHHKIVGAASWGKSVETLKMVDAARARGVDVTIDVYPYTASATSVSSALLPAWALEGSRQALLDRLRDPATRARVKAETILRIQNERGGGDPKNVQFASCGFDRSLAGKTLADLTRQRGLAVSVENAAEATLWLVEQGGCAGITLEDAVRKMAGFPAARLRLTDRGILRPGMKADIAVFDPDTVRDTATFSQPHQYAEGFSRIIVNGQVVFENGAVTAARPGKVLYGPGRLR
jgi:N-acyl-D-amino-acid deacylase